MRQLNEQTVQEWKTETLNSLYHFDKYILGYDATLRPEKQGLELKTHLDACRFIEGKYIEEPDIETRPFKLCEMPRGSLKSSAITVGYTVQRVIKNPNIRVLITNEVYDNSKKFLDEVSSHFETNEVLTELYGEFVDKKRWTKEEITVRQRTVRLKEPTVSIGSLSVLKVGMHYDLIIIDDWVSENNIGSKEMMDYVIKQYKLALSLLQPDGQIIIIGTRWHFNDLYNYIEKNERHRFNVFKRGAYNQDGKLFYPEKLTEKFLNDQRISQGSYVFSCQYLNDPVDEESAHFKKSWIRLYEIDNAGQYRPSDVPDKFSTLTPVQKNVYYTLEQMNTFMTIDPSSGVSHDYSGIVVGAVDPANRVFLLEAFKKKLNPPALVNLMFEYKNKYKGIQMGIEYAAMQITLKFMLHEAMAAREDYFFIKQFESTYAKSKADRIKSLTWRFEFGTIFLSPDMADLIDEILRFPVGSYDDILDALAYQPEMWTVPILEDNDNAPEGSIAWIKQQIDAKKNEKFYIGQQKNDDRWDIYG
jgi:predicted phage terminase large subunit-like protein